MNKILIVDDDKFITSVYQNRFRKEGFYADVAADGAAALEMLKKESWDLVLLDLQLPDVTGVEILKFIRAEPAMRKLPVIVFSNAYLNVLVEAAWQAGADQLLAKAQCTPNQLVDAVRKTLAAAPPATSSQKRFSIAQLRTARTPAPPPLPPRGDMEQTVFVQNTGKNEDLQSELRRMFLEEAPQVLTDVRDKLQIFLRARGEAALRDSMQDLSRSVHALVGSAGIAGYRRIAQLASAMEALFQEMHEQPHKINMSSLRTIVRAVDALADLCNRTSGEDPDSAMPPLALAVDDDDLSRQAVCTALEKVHMRTVAVSDPSVALNLLLHNRFELVLLDVDMPGMDGFTLCTKMRTMPASRDTPVIFVTGLNQFENLACSKLFEKEEFIAKPFPMIELAVKALTYLLRS